VSIDKRTTRTETRRTEATTIETSETSETSEEGNFARIATPPFSNRKKAPQETAWSYLTTFEVEDVTAAGDHIPGQARTRVRVTLAAINETGDPVAFADGELASIVTLVNYASGATLSNEWVVEPARSSSGGAAIVHTVDFIVSSAVGCPTPVDVAASIARPGSDEPVQTRPGHAGGAEDDFDSKVSLLRDKVPLWTINEMKVTLGTDGQDTVFVNGRQQIKVQIEFQATDRLTGAPAILTDEELKSLTLAFANTSKNLPVECGTGDGQATQEWWFTSPGTSEANDVTYDKGYDAYKGSLPAAGSPGAQVNDEPSPRLNVFRYFYIGCNGGPAQAVKLCASVRCKDGWKYFSNQTSFDSCGGEHYEPDLDSQVDLRGVQPESASADRFGWEMTVIKGDAAGINPTSIHQYTLSFHGSSPGDELGIKRFEVDPKSMILWHDKVGGEMRSCWTGYVAPGGEEVTSDSAISGKFEPLAVPVGAENAAVILAGRTDLGYPNGNPGMYFAGPVTLKIIDRQGNEQVRYVSFDNANEIIGDRRWKLMLS
jgi:hypothetical protein